MEMSRARSSSAVGVRPMPYGGPCASAGTHISDANANANARRLRQPIGHAPVTGDFPGLDAVVQPRHAERLIVGFVPVLGDLLARRLHLSDLVDAPRQDLGLVAIPVPRVGETAMRHPLRCAAEFGLVPFLAAVDRHLHLLDGAAAGPGEAADLVEAFAGQPLVAGRKRDDRLWADLI